MTQTIVKQLNKRLPEKQPQQEETLQLNKLAAQRQLRNHPEELDLYLLVYACIASFKDRLRKTSPGAWRTSLEFAVFALEKVKVFL